MVGMSVPEKEAHEFVKTSHDFALWMIQLADAKADILMAASAILAGLLVPQVLRPSSEVVRGMWVLAVGFAVLSAGLSLAAVFPRTGRGEHASLLYFTRIVEFGSGRDYHTHLQTLQTGQHDLETAIQTWELARTQAKKYSLLRAGVVAFALCLSTAFLGVLLSLQPVS